MSRRWRGAPRNPFVTASASSSVTTAVESQQGCLAPPSDSKVDSRNHNVFSKARNCGRPTQERRSTASTVSSKNSIHSTCSQSGSASGMKALLLEDDPSLRSVASEFQSSFTFNDSISLLRESGEDEARTCCQLPQQQNRPGSTYGPPPRSHDDEPGGRAKVVTAVDSSSSVQRRSVAFSTVELYIHSRTLGDNPSVSSGPPIAIGQDVLRTERHDVDEYERFREETVPRRSKRGLLLGRIDREDLLKEYGYSRSDFVAAENEIRKLQVQRRASSRRSLLERAAIKARKLFQTRTAQPLTPPTGASKH